MEKYNLHMRREVFDRVSKCMSTYIEADKWFPVKVLGDLMEVDLSGIFGNGNLGWSPSTLLYCCQSAETTFSMYMSLPKPEEIPACPDGRTVREQMDDLDSRERPALEDWLSKNGIGLAGALKSSARESLARLNNAVNGGFEDANTGLSDPCERENVRSEEPNALFVTIETGAFEVTPENIEAVNSFISNAGEGRDIHLRIV